MFESARLKVQWANHHVNQLKLGIERYVAAHRDIVIVERDVEVPETRVKTGQFAPITPDLTMMAGSAAQILRSSLDHATSEVLNSVKGTDYRTTFPVSKTRDGLERSSSLRTISGACEKLAEVILDEINPTKTGNYPIWALNRLANTDKHRSLILLTQLTGYRAALSLPGQPFPCHFTFVAPASHQSDDFQAIGHALEKKSKVEPVLEILIGETDAFHNRELVPMLTNCSHVVSKTLDAIERAVS